MYGTTERTNHEAIVYNDANLLWNFNDSTNEAGYTGKITLAEKFQGTVLATAASLFANSNVDGSIIVDQYLGSNGETHRWDYQGTKLTDEPTTPGEETPTTPSEDSKTTTTNGRDDANNSNTSVDGNDPTATTVSNDSAQGHTVSATGLPQTGDAAAATTAAGVGALFVALMAFFKGRRKNRSAK